MVTIGAIGGNSSSNVDCLSFYSDLSELGFNRLLEESRPPEIDPEKFHRILTNFKELRAKNEASSRELENRCQDDNFTMSIEAAETCLALDLLTGDGEVSSEVSKTIAVFNDIVIQIIIAAIVDASSRICLSR